MNASRLISKIEKYLSNLSEVQKQAQSILNEVIALDAYEEWDEKQENRYDILLKKSRDLGIMG